MGLGLIAADAGWWKSECGAPTCACAVIVVDMFLHNHDFTFPFLHTPACARLSCAFVYFTCMRLCLMGVCAWVTAAPHAGQRVQPSCSLLGHSVRWYTNLIHFALTLNSLSLPLLLHFRINISNMQLHFCCTRCCINVLCYNTNWTHPWDCYVG